MHKKQIKNNSNKAEKSLKFIEFKKQVLNDYRIITESRLASLIGRKKVLSGKAKFGIFGDGKEVAQIAMAKVFENGDFRSGYYRDQTFMLATNTLTIEQFFAQLYANPDINCDPHSGGRQMNAHFATRSLKADGTWENLMKTKNSSADTSPTANQMIRSVGLALASKHYRANKELHKFKNFSNKGNEVVFCTIGDAGTSEGLFWEVINAAGVLKIPLIVSIWDDDYGISVPKKYQTTKKSISEILKGFQVNEKGEGIDIYVVKGWDYPALCKAYEKVIAKVRETHTPAIIHIEELTQPQGHSTSGSHERYKSKERLRWEKEYDCIKKMREWILDMNIAVPAELEQIEKDAEAFVKNSIDKAWNAFIQPIKDEIVTISDLFEKTGKESGNAKEILSIKDNLQRTLEPFRKDIVKAVKEVLTLLRFENTASKTELINWLKETKENNKKRYSSHLYSQSAGSALKIPEIKPAYADNAPMLFGFEVINKCFEAAFNNDPRIVAFGEDVGKLGGVNQGFASLQEKFGEIRIFDTGIREATIIGKGIGLAMRGLKPIADIQYLDYLLYGIQTLSDDLATLHYRTKGGQKAPVIIRTRGHRLEGIWHSGSPMGMIIHSLRGIYVICPRNFVQASGFYNTMLRSDDSALIIEPLNTYRIREKLPDNIGNFTIPLGIPEILHTGNDVSIVTYGSCCAIAMEAIEQLEKMNISCELIDVQTLLPFDINHKILASLKKTNRIIFLDEDVPGGATAYMLQEVLEKQGGYNYLDSSPKTITAQPHRPAYGTDGDYFSKPNAEDIIEAVYSLMNEADSNVYPPLPY